MPEITPKELGALRELLTAIRPNLSRSISAQIHRDIVLGAPVIEAVPIQDILARTESVVGSVYSLSAPVVTENVMLFSEDLGSIFVDLIEGNEGADPPILLTEEQNEKLTSAIVNVIWGLAISIGTLRGLTVEVESCTTHIGPITIPPIFALEDAAVQAVFSLSIPEVKETSLFLLFTPEMVLALNHDAEGGEASGPVDAGTVVGEDQLTAMMNDIGAGPLTLSMPTSHPSQGAVPPAASGPSAQDNSATSGMGLVLDIPLDVSVELGRSRLRIRDVLELGAGSIVELNRMAGHPVDLMIDGRLVAKGEVIVIEDNLGIRITEIINPTERISGPGKGK